MIINSPNGVLNLSRSCKANQVDPSGMIVRVGSKQILLVWTELGAPLEVSDQMMVERLGP